MAIGPTRGKERLGALVRGYMTRSGKKVDDVVKAARTSRDTVYNLLSGENRPRYGNFLAILGILGVSDEERANAVALWEVADDEKVRIEFAADLPPRYLKFRRWESEAIEELTLDPSILPGILQTAGYAQACALGAQLLIKREGWRDIAASERKERQSLLYRDIEPLGLRALLDEAALHRLIGGRDVMDEQYRHLLELGALPDVEIRAIPYGAGAYGIHTGALTLLRFPEEDSTVAAYIDTILGLSAVDGGEQVQALCGVWDAAERLALSAADTAELIREVRESQN